MTYVNTYYMPIDSDEEFGIHLARRLNAMYASSPDKAGDRLILLKRDVRYVPTFHISMTLDHWSYNTTGRAVNHELESKNILMRASQKMEFTDERFLKYVFSKKQANPSIVYHGIESKGNADISVLVNGLINDMVRRNTYRFSYMGKNGRYYTRTTNPTPRDVYVNNVDIIYIVESHVEYMLSGKQYSFDTIETQSPNFYRFSRENFVCPFCNEPIEWDGMICNECGKIFHKQHGNTCSLCQKTLCSGCQSKYKKYFFLTRYICHSCISKNPQIKLK